MSAQKEKKACLETLDPGEKRAPLVPPVPWARKVTRETMATTDCQVWSDQKANRVGLVGTVNQVLRVLQEHQGVGRKGDLLVLRVLAVFPDLPVPPDLKVKMVNQGHPDPWVHEEDLDFRAYLVWKVRREKRARKETLA